MRVLVVGGTGQLGLASIPELVRAGHEVRATAREEPAVASVRNLGAEPVKVDVFDPGSLRGAVRGMDAVLRLTTRIPPMTRMRSPRSWAANNRLRTEGARLLAEAVVAEDVGRYVSESVTFVYAASGESWIGESDPVDIAGIGILEAASESEEHALKLAGAGRVPVVLRFGSFYSPTSGQTRAIASLVRRRLFPVIGSGEAFYSSIAVVDAGAAVAAALELPPGIYNVVDDQPLPYREYVCAYVDALGAPAPLSVPRAAAGVTLGVVARFVTRSSRVANTRIKANSSWAPRYPSAREGLAAIAESL